MSIGSNFLYCKVLATKKDLIHFGIDSNLTNCIAEHIKDFKDGYSEIRIKNEKLSALFKEDIYENYHIPKYFLNFLNF